MRRKRSTPWIHRWSRPLMAGIASIGAVLFLSIGAGAVLQVIVEVGSYLICTAQKQGSLWLSKASLAEFGLGLAVMYGTALLVSA